MFLFETIKDLITPRTKISRLLFMALIMLGILMASVILVFSELKKQDISKSQLEIEKNRVSQIDKQLANLYEKTYAPKDSSLISKGLDQGYFLKQIEFLKSQRVEAIKSIDDINNPQNTQLLIFTLLASALTIVLLIFFTNSFKSSIRLTTKENFERFSVEHRKTLTRKNGDFLQWVTTNELANSNISALEIEKAKRLKNIYDLSEALGEQRNNFLNSVIEYTKVTRSQDEIKNDKHSEILSVFEDIQERLKDECNRLNKQAIINLLLCFFIAFALMTLITYTSIFSAELHNLKSFENFIVGYIPRIIAVIGLLTMFLYFTKLYKTNILDVKYYQNELTNIEIMQVTLQTAIINGNQDVLNKLLSDFAIIDRNKIITKEQTSIEIERLKIENELNKNYLDKAYDLLSFTRTDQHAEKNGL